MKDLILLEILAILGLLAVVFAPIIHVLTVVLVLVATFGLAWASRLAPAVHGRHHGLSPPRRRLPWFVDDLFGFGAILQKLRRMWTILEHLLTTTWTRCLHRLATIKTTGHATHYLLDLASGCGICLTFMGVAFETKRWRTGLRWTASALTKPISVTWVVFCVCATVLCWATRSLLTTPSLRGLGTIASTLTRTWSRPVVACNERLSTAPA